MMMKEIGDEYKIPPLIDGETEWGYHRFREEHERNNAQYHSLQPHIKK